MWKIVFIVFFVLAIAGMATFLLLPDQKILERIEPSTQATSPTQTPVLSPQAPDQDPRTSDEKYIKEALDNSTSLECDYTDAEGRQVKTYIKNGDVRSNYTAQNPSDSAVTIIKDKKMFVWNTSTKEGYMLIINAPQGIVSSDSDTTYSVVADLEKYKQFCKSATVADDLFIPPADVKLEDFSQEGPDAEISSEPQQ